MSFRSHGNAGNGGRYRLILAVFFVALALRTIYFLEIVSSPFFESPVIDALTYHERAVEIAEGAWHEQEVFWQPPLYPYLLGMLYAVVGPKIAVARALQLLLGALVCSGVAVLASRLHGRLAGWVAGLVLAASGTSIFFEGELLNPILSIALNTGALLVLIPSAREGSSRRGALSESVELSPVRWAGAGLLLGLSAISRPDVLVFAAVLGLVALAPLVTRLPSRRASPSPVAAGTARWARPVVFAAALLLPILPVTVHNVVFGGEWVPISSNAGLNFYLGNSTEYEQTVGIRPGLHWNQLMLEPLRSGVAEDDAAGLSAWWTRRSLEAIRAAPERWLADAGHKLVVGLGAAETGRNLELEFFSRYAPLLGWLPGWGLLFPLGAIGAFLARRDKRDGVLLAFAGCYALTLLAFFVSARYRVPLFPVLAILTGFTVERVVSWWRGGRRSSVAALLGAVLVLLIAVRAAGTIGDRSSESDREADGHYLVAKALAHRGQDAAAALALEASLTLAPENWDAVHDLAAAWTNLGRGDRALGLYQRILVHHPEDRESLLAMSDLLVSLGRKREAVERLEASAAGPWATPDLVGSISRALAALGESEAALEVGLDAVARGTVDPRLETLVGQLEDVHRERRRLAECLEQVPEVDPIASPGPSDTARAELALAEGLLRAGKHLEAELAVAGALTACEDLAAAWAALGKLWFLQGSALAPDALRRAVRIDPNLAEAHLGLAHSLASDPGARPEAVAALEAFLALEPEGNAADQARRALAGLNKRDQPRPESALPGPRADSGPIRGGSPPGG